MKDIDKILEKDAESDSSLYAFPHYLVLDTNIVLDQVREIVA